MARKKRAGEKIRNEGMKTDIDSLATAGAEADGMKTDPGSLATAGAEADGAKTDVGGHLLIESTGIAGDPIAAGADPMDGAKTDVGGHLIVESSGIAGDPIAAGADPMDGAKTDVGGHLMVEASGIAGGPSDPMGGLDSVVSGRKLGLHSIGSAKTDVGGHLIIESSGVKKGSKKALGKGRKARPRPRAAKKGPGIVRKGVGKTLGLAKTVIMTAVLISVAGAGVDVYQTYNDAIAIDLEEHITDADFELSDDKSEISGTVGFDIPEMGMFEKSIIASVHVTVLESNPTTEGDYEFEYTLGTGEQFYDFTLDDLDPVTVEKIEAGESLDIEYSGTISVTYLGVEIPSVTMDIPLTTTTVETA